MWSQGFPPTFVCTSQTSVSTDSPGEDGLSVLDKAKSSDIYLSLGKCYLTHLDVHNAGVGKLRQTTTQLQISLRYFFNFEKNHNLSLSLLTFSLNVNSSVELWNHSVQEVIHQFLVTFFFLDIKPLQYCTLNRKMENYFPESHFLILLHLILSFNKAVLMPGHLSPFSSSFFVFSQKMIFIN